MVENVNLFNLETLNWMVVLSYQNEYVYFYKLYKYKINSN